MVIKMNSRLLELIRNSHSTVFFGGAGVSTESGIPDFRSTDGIYNQKYKYPPEVILSHSFFMRRPEEFFDFFREKMLYADAEPNAAHLALAALEAEGKLNAVITQNIDGLHQAAGSVNVLELHGSVLHSTCMSCSKKYGLDAVTDSSGVPRCSCGGIIKPDVVLYEESLDQNVLEQSIKMIKNAELLIVGGTSLNVYPAAGLINYFNGDNLVIINKTPTQADSSATLLITEPIGTVFSGYGVYSPQAKKTV